MEYLNLDFWRPFEGSGGTGRHRQVAAAGQPCELRMRIIDLQSSTSSEPPIQQSCQRKSWIPAHRVNTHRRLSSCIAKTNASNRPNATQQPRRRFKTARRRRAEGEGTTSFSHEIRTRSANVILALLRVYRRESGPRRMHALLHNIRSPRILQRLGDKIPELHG